MRNINWVTAAIGTGIRRIDSGTIRRGFKERERELLIHNTHIKVNEPRARNINANTFNRKPKKKFLCRDARQLADPAETQGPRDVEIVVNLILELRIAGMLQKDLKIAGRGVVRELSNTLRQEAYGEAMEAEVVIDGGWGGRCGGYEKGKEEK